MKIYVWAATATVISLLLFSPVMAGEPLEAVEDSKSPVSAKQSQGTKDPIQGGSAHIKEPAESTKSDKTTDKTQPETVEAEGAKESQEGKEDTKKGSQAPKPGAAKKAEKPKRVFIEVPEDRRWIIKQHSLEGMKIPEEKPALIQWENKDQKARCEPYIGQLKDNFLKARYYSIQGDPCVTAKYAKEFMKLVEKCEGECPEEFLEKRGYDDRVIKNLNTLYELGTDGCLK